MISPIVWKVRRLISLLCALSLIGAFMVAPRSAGAEEFKTVSSYDEYLVKHSSASRAAGEILLVCAQNARCDGARVMEQGYLDIDEPCLYIPGGGGAAWTLDAPSAGLYAVQVRYSTIENQTGNVEISLALNGALPYAEARDISLGRLWTDAGEIKTDSRGNQVRSRQVSFDAWQTRYLTDNKGYYSEPLLFYLEKGSNAVELASSRDSAVFYSLSFACYSPAPDYSRPDGEVADCVIHIEGEQAAYKTSPMLYGVNDRSSPFVTPYDGSKIIINSIGGENWKNIDQQITWRFTCEQTGLYAISIRAKQSISPARLSHRELLIDGELPFAQAASLEFAYSTDWNDYLLKDAHGEPYLLSLTEGEHELTLRATLGDTAEIARGLADCVSKLNDAYRRVIMVTGTSPDAFRDYNLEKNLPSVINAFSLASSELYALEKMLIEQNGTRGEDSGIVSRIAMQLESFVDKPFTIASRLSDFKSNLSALSALIIRLGEQYLAVDSIQLGDPKQMSSPSGGFFGTLAHETRNFFASFTGDFNTIGDIGSGDTTIKVWISSGRDQAQILKRLIDDTFTPATGISVDLKLVTAQSLIPSTISGNNPGVALSLGTADPVNFAMRGALADLTQFDDFEDVAERFMPESLVPFEYSGGVYALPETTQFLVMFYRTDIFAELGLAPPQTWDEFYTVLAELQKHNFEVGLPYTAVNNYGYGTLNGGMQTYSMLLLQRGGRLYADGGTRSALTEREGVEAFRTWTNLFLNYQLPLTYDFANRFRLGEMPLVIADYTSYNLISVFAPEIKGLWAFTLVPGTPSGDTLNRAVPLNGQGCVIFKNNNPDIQACWEFLKWWTSAQTQSDFGLEIESIMGASARYATANVEALEMLPWSRAEFAVISEQMKWAIGIPEVPGGYFTPRHIDNAFRAAVYSDEDAKDALINSVRQIDEELTAKRIEFKLIKAEEEEAK